MFFFIFNAKNIPEWGMTKDTLKGIGYPGESEAVKILFDNPHVIIAFGLTYFCLLTIIEIIALGSKFGEPFIKSS